MMRRLVMLHSTYIQKAVPEQVIATRSYKSRIPLYVTVALLWGTCMSGHAQTFMSRNLTSSDWWIASDDEEGQGQGFTGGQTAGEWATLKYVPASGTTPAFTRFRLFSYNPNSRGKGKSVLFPLVKSSKAFKGPKGGKISFEARMKFGPVRPGGGIVCGFYPYTREGYTPGDGEGDYGRNEIDMEFLHKQMPLGKIWTNIYEDYDARASAGQGSWSNQRLDAFYEWRDQFYLKKADITDWATTRNYKITWSSGATYWYVNGTQLSAQRRSAQFEGLGVPVANYNKSLQVHMNMWSPERTNSWQQAVDPNFHPASNSDDSQSWYYDVEFVRVTGTTQVKGKLKTRKRGRG